MTVTTENEKKQEEKEEPKQVANPWEVSAKGKVDYDKLIDRFGWSFNFVSLVHHLSHSPRLSTMRHFFSPPVPPSISSIHSFPYLLKRKFDDVVSLCHNNFMEILDAYERGDRFYLYTGHGPCSEALHLGHLIPFMFTKWVSSSHFFILIWRILKWNLTFNLWI